MSDIERDTGRRRADTPEEEVTGWLQLMASGGGIAFEGHVVPLEDCGEHCSRGGGLMLQFDLDQFLWCQVRKPHLACSKVHRKVHLIEPVDT